MKPNWLIVIIAFFLGIGTVYLLKPTEKLTECEPFTLKGTPIKIDSSRKNAFVRSNKNIINGDILFTTPVDTSSVSNYVRNYKNRYRGGTYSFTILGGDIADYGSMRDFKGIRVYLGLKTANDPSSGTVIITGINAQGGDLYLTRMGREMAIDQASPCPTDCPNRKSQATNANEPSSTSRDMLGRMTSDLP